MNLNNGKQFLLPLFNIKKPLKSKFSEKQLILFLMFVSLLSFYLIFKNLPSNVSLNENKESILKNVFLPVVDSNDSGKLIHRNEKEHEKLHNILIPVDVEKKKFSSSTEKIKELLKETPKNNEKTIVNLDDDIFKKRETIKNMTLLAWNGYKKYAWGSNELKPLSKTGHSAGIFGQGSLGATIVDALDTLYIMGLFDEFNAGKEWVDKNFNMDINTEMSAFEINIRFVGGFLSAYALSNDKMFLDKAQQVANLFLPIFDSPTGIPYALLNPKTKSKRNYHWASGSCSILAELGSFSLEYQYLSDITGNKIYEEKINKIYDALEKAPKDEGLYYNYINPSSGQWCGRQANLGALADSFYEYLIKLYLFKSKTDKKLLDVYLKSMKASREKIIGVSQGGFTFAGEYSGGLAKKMGHLSCFVGGMFAITSMYVDELNAAEKETYRKLAVDITNTCHESYVRTPTHIGPETFHLDGDNVASVASNEKYYILRPEVVESYFYLWRVTKDNKYREWAWDFVQALEKYCRTENGYSGLSDVYDVNSRKDDVQQSFFLAETLKYLYLIFSDDEKLPLDKFVFNTEAHPLPIRKL